MIDLLGLFFIPNIEAKVADEQNLLTSKLMWLWGLLSKPSHDGGKNFFKL